MNICFNYLYRDGANYKQHHYEIFSNSRGISIQEIEEAIIAALIDGEWFYADRWQLQDLHVYKWDNVIDHEWHEFNSIEETLELSTKGDITDFLAILENTGK